MKNWTPDAVQALPDAAAPCTAGGGADPAWLGGWLEALPIATAVLADSGSGWRARKGNPAFRRLVASLGAADESFMGWLADHALEAQVTGAASRIVTWQSPDRVMAHRIEASLVPMAGEGMFVSLIDRTAELENQRNLRRELLSDPLTGLPNRTGLEEEIEARAAQYRLAKTQGERDGRAGSVFAVFIVDLARFSRINEASGQVLGDELLLATASRLRAILRRRDLVARVGSNEFALLTAVRRPEVDIPRVAERIQSVFRDPFRLSNLEIQMDAAIGAAIGRLDDSDPEQALRQALVALKDAKRLNSFRLYRRDVHDQVRRRFALETDLRRALERGELELAFQPLVDLHNGAISGFEALARWQHPDRGAISPAEFIPIAEESGLIVPLGRWAIEHAAQTLADWDVASGGRLPVKVNVNLSPVQFARDNVAEVVEGAIGRAGVHGSRLTLELTESAIFSDPERARRVLEGLKRLDTTLAMDDFGTGYSNLASLQSLPIDVLKIDRSFVTEMLSDNDKVSIVRAVLSLASALGMQTTAEGIETLELSTALANLGCSQGQGFYFAKPLPADAALRFFREWQVRPAEVVRLASPAISRLSSAIRRGL